MKTAWAGAVYNLMLFMLASHVNNLFFVLVLVLLSLRKHSKVFDMCLGFGVVLVPFIHRTTNGMLEKGLQFGGAGLRIWAF